MCLVTNQKELGAAYSALNRAFLFPQHKKKWSQAGPFNCEFQADTALKFIKESNRLDRVKPLDMNQRELKVMTRFLKNQGKCTFKKLIYRIGQFFLTIFCQKSDKKRFHAMMVSQCFSLTFVGSVTEVKNPDNAKLHLEFAQTVHKGLLTIGVDYVQFYTDLVIELFQNGSQLLDESRAKERYLQICSKSIEMEKISAPIIARCKSRITA
ncbi:MAG: hypothetical protein MRY21_07565 [Simkaniaceae bacterium]|nr:hypothetical protein [Simkaniaceae bacterium]